MKLNQNLRSRLEEALETQGYSVRYEKGNFRGGECLLETQKIIVVNKFHPVETQVGSLAEIFLGLHLDVEALCEEQRKLLGKLRNHGGAPKAEPQLA